MTEVKKKIQEMLDTYINDYGEIGVDGENEEAMVSEILSLIQEERLKAIKEVDTPALVEKYFKRGFDAGVASARGITR